MSKNQFAYSIQKEILILNERIDRKIIKGRPYVKDASRHKALLKQLAYFYERPQKAKRGLFSFL